MQKYKEINGNDYVKDSRTTINETMQSIQSMNSGTVFPTTNLFEGMKCYRTDLKKTYTLTDVENNTWVEDAHAELADEATHAASATKLQTARSLNLGGAVTADAATFDGTADTTINVKTLDASKLKGTAPVSTTGNAATATKLATARTIALGGNASGSATFDGSGNVTINTTVNESAHAATATKVVTNAAAGASANIAEATMAGSDYARIRVSDATNAGELALETADDGSEPIVARQYTGNYSNVARTAKILDESGNTSFPGTVVAPKFTGTLNGNAATASKLATPRTLSLTGKAAGSTTFDGSSNASINVTSVNADTASKLSTARKISITGNATGAAAFDGSGDISINTTVNESKHAAAATTVNATVPNGGAADLVFGIMANDDSARIRVGGSADNGWLEIATSDNGNEPIYARQYSGSFLQDGAKSIANEAAILDGNGNTKFPKNVTAASFTGPLNGNAATATKLQTPRTISLTGNASGSASFDGSGNVSINTTVSNSAAANKLADESGNNHINIDSATDSWSVIGSNPGKWLKSIRTNPSAPPYSIGNYSAAVAFGEYDTKGIITHAYDRPLVKFAGGNGSTAVWKFSIYGGMNNETYDLNNFPTKTGSGASGTWGINISGTAAGLSGDLNFPDIGDVGTSRKISWNGSTDGADIYYQTTKSNQGNLVLNLRDDPNCYLRIASNGAFKSYFSPSDGNFHGNVNGNADTATNADKLDGYHASDILNKITAANTGGIVAASLTENGYAKFANGLILQWGTMTGPKVDDWVWVTTTFPIAFASACFSVTCCDELTSTYDGDVESFVRNIKTNSVDIRYRSDHLGRNLRWLALGV